MEECKRNRIISIDIIRISLMIIIFAFHTNIHMNCTYGVMTNFFKNGNLVMTTFFMLSGFSIFYANNKRNMMSIQEIKNFYKKRIIGIYPSYLFIVIFYLIFSCNISLEKRCALLPMDISMIQSTVDGSSSTLHYGGTWFVSCLFICYLLTPFFIEVLKQLETKKVIKLGIVIYLICAYIPFIVKSMGYSSIYANVIYRSLHFFIGCIIAAIYIRQNLKSNSNNNTKNFGYLIISLILVTVVILAENDINKNLQNNSTEDYLIILSSALLIYISSFIKVNNEIFRKVVSNKVIKYANEIAYEFFLGQFFCFNITLRIMKVNSNKVKIVISGIICIIIAIILHELVTKPCKKLLNKYTTKKQKQLV